MRTLPLLLVLACGPTDDDATTDDVPTDDTGASDSGGDTGDTGTDLAGWGPGEELTLRLTEVTPPTIRLDLDRDEVADLFGDRASEVVMLELDPLPMLRATLDRVKEACGTDWKRDTANPTFDCESTALGRSFSTGADGTWRSGPEFQLVRILTMTPSNAIVDGTSLSTLAGIANFLGLGGGFGQILSDGLQIGRTEEFLDTEVLAIALKETLLASHPNMAPGGLIPFTLADALSDLRTFGPRFGPAGQHPGIVDPSVPTSGQVFGPDFRMVLEVRSNLRVLDGVDLSGGKDYLGLVVDETGPTFDDEVEFDFADPDAFFVEGLADDPRADLRLVMSEHPSFVPACRGVSPGLDCRQNLPGSPRGAGTVWTTAPWTIEHVIARGGQVKYDGLRNRICYLTCFGVDLSIGQGNDPAGFARFDVALNIGNPPPDQYGWELITEVAQARMHDAGLSEGETNVALTLEALPVGVTGAEAAEAVRPFLAEQGGILSSFLLGDFRKNSGPVDLFYRRTEDGQPTLFWVAPDDLSDDARRTYDMPGLYADPELTLKRSSTVVPGSDDTTHEKWRVPAGDSTVYAVDDEGRRYRLDVTAPDLGAATAEIAIVVREAL